MVSTSNKSLRIQLSSSSLYGDNFEFHPGSGLPIKCFGLGFKCDLVTCFVLAIECLTMNVAHDFELVCSFPCIMLMQSFVLLLPFGVKGILSSWKVNVGDFQYSQKFPLDTILYVSLFYCFYLCLHILYLFPIPMPLPW